MIREEEVAEWLGTPEVPEDVLATPVEIERLDEQTYRMYFRTGDIDWPKEYEGEEVTLGLGVFPERTIPEEYFDTTRFTPGDFTT